MRDSGDKLYLESCQSLRPPGRHDEHPHTYYQHQKNSKADRQVFAPPGSHSILNGPRAVLDDQLPATVFRPLHDHRCSEPRRKLAILRKERRALRQADARSPARSRLSRVPPVEALLMTRAKELDHGIAAGEDLVGRPRIGNVDWGGLIAGA